MTEIYSEQLQRAVKHYPNRLNYYDDRLFPGEAFFLSSYPRSGNHFVRFNILSALHYKQTGTFPDDYSLLGMLPDLHRPDLANNKIYRPIVIKTHHPCDPRYKNIIHLIRDPRDVIVSYYHFTHGQLTHYFKKPYTQPTIDEFIEHFIAGNVWPGDLRYHTQSYLDVASKINYIQLRYEKLLSDPRTEFGRLFAFMNVDLPGDIIDKLIKHTSFENMTRLFSTRTTENSSGFTRKESITRKGGSGGYQDELSEELIARLQQAFGKYLPDTE